MARLGHLYAGDEPALIRELDRLLELGRETLERRRETVHERIDGGLYPYTRRYLGHLGNHCARRYLGPLGTPVSTLGVNGMTEMVRNCPGDHHARTDEAGQEMSLRILDHVRERMVECQEQTGTMYNLEATPAEGATYRFAK